MKKLLLILPFILVPQALASSSSVEIHNNVSSSQSTTTSSTSHTKVSVETNGVTTSYESDKGGDVSVNSENGKTEIKENGVVVSGNSDDSSTSPTPNISKAPSATPSPATTERHIIKSGIFEMFKMRLFFFWRLFHH